MLCAKMQPACSFALKVKRLGEIGAPRWLGRLSAELSTLAQVMISYDLMVGEVEPRTPALTLWSPLGILSSLPVSLCPSSPLSLEVNKLLKKKKWEKLGRAQNGRREMKVGGGGRRDGEIGSGEGREEDPPHTAP